MYLLYKSLNKFSYTLSDELQRFLNEINSETKESDIITCDDVMISLLLFSPFVKTEFS